MNMQDDGSESQLAGDSVIREVRLAREAYAAQFDYDLRRMVEDLKAKEELHPERRATLIPLTPATAA